MITSSCFLPSLSTSVFTALPDKRIVGYPDPLSKVSSQIALKLEAVPLASASTRKTSLPDSDLITAKLVETVVLPTPPLIPPQTKIISF